jgi:hypothetical protein
VTPFPVLAVEVPRVIRFEADRKTHPRRAASARAPPNHQSLAIRRRRLDPHGGETRRLRLSARSITGVSASPRSQQVRSKAESFDDLADRGARLEARRHDLLPLPRRPLASRRRLLSRRQIRPAAFFLRRSPRHGHIAARENYRTPKSKSRCPWVPGRLQRMWRS